MTDYDEMSHAARVRYDEATDLIEARYEAAVLKLQERRVKALGVALSNYRASLAEIARQGGVTL
jgi:hypothetical protein